MCVFMRVRQDSLFSDEHDWEVPGLENPYYFDHRGEIERNASKNDEPAGLSDRLVALEAKLAAVSQRQSVAPKKQESALKSDEVEHLLVQVLRELQGRPKMA